MMKPSKPASSVTMPCSLSLSMPPSREEDMSIPPPRAALHFRKHRRSILGSSGTKLSLLLKIRNFVFPVHILPDNRNIKNLSERIKKKYIVFTY
jgi:hypothetical protein